MTSNVQLVGLEPGLSRQDTLLASDIWTESCQGVSCLPTPIPSRIEPSISFQVYNKPVGDDIDNLTPPSTPRSLPWTLQLADVDKVDKDIPTSVTLESGLQSAVLSRQDTLLASDPIWTKSPFVSGLPTLIPYRNEPPMSFHILPEGINSLTPRSAPRSLESLPQTLQLAEVDKVDIDVQISVTPESGHQSVGLSRQDTLLASDPIWMKSPYVSGIPTPIPPRNEPSISTFIMSALDDIATSTNCQ